MAKTLREVMTPASYGDIKIGDEVQIINSGHVGKVELIGHMGYSQFPHNMSICIPGS